MVNLYINDERIDLQGDEVIAASYQIAPFSDIAKRSAFQTISFDVPKTANNKRILENAQVIQNGSTLPYSYMKARVDVDGIDQQITSAELVSVKESFKLKLFGGNIDFFALIKDVRLNDLDLSDLDHTFDITEIVASFTNTGGYIYPIIDFHTDSPNTAMPSASADVDVRWLFPAYFVHTLVDRIVTDAGFTAIGDFLTDTNYLSCILPCSGFGTDEIHINETQDFEAGLNLGLNEIVPLQITVSGTGITLLKDSTVTIRGLTDATETITLRVPEDKELGTGTTAYLLLEKVSGSLNFYEGVNAGDPAVVYYFTIGNDYRITFDLNFRNANNSGGVDIDVGYIYDTVYPLQTDVINFRFGFDYGSYITSAALPPLKQSDFLKTIAQMFGLLIIANPITKKVHFLRYTEIVENKENALDWSSKVDYSEEVEINFKDTSYAQVNNCTYQDDDTVVKPTGTDYELLVSNTTLKPENDLFESIFAATESVQRLNGKQLNQIKIYTDAGGADEEIGEVQPRILVIRTEQFSPALELNEGGATMDTATSAPLTHFIEVDETFNLGWSDNLIPAYSQEIIDTVSRYKMVLMLLRLTSSDINQLDFSVPVWIETRNDSGAYYYVSSINQFKFTSRESTEVELVKLP